MLVVDDEPELASLTAEALAGYGYDCTVCVGSPAALERFAEAPNDFDVVITDQTMPVMTGIEFIERLRVLRPDVPVVLASGHSEAVDAVRARELGITYLHKPVAPESLAAAIDAALNRAASSPSS